MIPLQFKKPFLPFPKNKCFCVSCPDVNDILFQVVKKCVQELDNSKFGLGKEIQNLMLAAVCTSVLNLLRWEEADKYERATTTQSFLHFFVFLQFYVFRRCCRRCRRLCNLNTLLFSWLKISKCHLGMKRFFAEIWNNFCQMFKSSLGQVRVAFKRLANEDTMSSVQLKIVFLSM